jgi:hypothetical protein
VTNIYKNASFPQYGEYPHDIYLPNTPDMETWLKKKSACGKFKKIQYFIYLVINVKPFLFKPNRILFCGSTATSYSR